MGIRTTNLALLFGDAIRRRNRITILRLDEMAALWFPRISHMGILTTNLAWSFEQLLCRMSHVARLLLVKIIHVETILESMQEFKKS